jgi:methylphosphotriester-DNA--protein-cysteine methyltransferase
MNKITTDFQCPRCGFVAKAETTKKYKLVLYVCPQCKSNVANYENKSSIISNRLVQTVTKHQKFKRCGELSFKKKERAPRPRELTKDVLLDLKILLETSNDVNSFIKNI